MTETTQVARLTGHCACCGAPTKVLFAMGHDARFRSALALAAGTDGWDAKVPWFTDQFNPSPVTVREALLRIGQLIGRDWSVKVRDAARNKGTDPGALDAPIDVAVFTTPPRAPRTEQSELDARRRGEERAEHLMARLAGPAAGRWGFFRDGNGRRFPARVHRTHRTEDSSLIDLAVYETGADTPGFPYRLIERVSPDTWTRDESAQDGLK